MMAHSYPAFAGAFAAPVYHHHACIVRAGRRVERAYTRYHGHSRAWKAVREERGRSGVGMTLRRVRAGPFKEIVMIRTIPLNKLRRSNTNVRRS